MGGVVNIVLKRAARALAAHAAIGASCSEGEQRGSKTALEYGDARDFLLVTALGTPSPWL